MKPIFVRAGLVLTLALCGCPSDPESPPGGTGGTGGSATGGRGGTGGSSTGGTGGSATGGSGGAGGSATGGSGGRSPDAGRTPDSRRIDAARTPDAGSTTDGGGTAAAVKCGTTRPTIEANKIAGIGSAEGIVITPDGTIYWTAPFGMGNHPTTMGRLRPPYTTPEPAWLNIGGQTLGITYDSKRKVIYAGRRMPTPALLKIDLTKEPPTAEVLSPVEMTINGVTLGEDEAVYYADQGGEHVHRVSPEGMKTQVTTTPLGLKPNGLAFGPGPAAQLFVVSYEGPTNVVRLSLTAGKETARENFVNLGATRADGIAFDKMGRMYVTAAGPGGMGAALYRIGADKMVTMVSESHGANIEFGVGPLSCNDAYVAGNGAGIRVHMLDAPGLEVPWHRE